MHIVVFIYTNKQTLTDNLKWMKLPGHMLVSHFFKEYTTPKYKRPFSKKDNTLIH